MYEHYRLSKTKIALCSLALVAAFIAYDHFIHQASAQDAEVPATNSASLTVINKIESLTLDKTILNDRTFTSLQDFSESIDKEEVGRPNPFAPSPGRAVQSPSPRTQTRGR